MKRITKINNMIKQRGFILSIIISILVHLAVIYKFEIVDFDKYLLKSSKKKVSISLIHRPKIDRKQFVDTLDKKKVDHKVNTKFSSKQNQIVDKETIASKIGAFKKGGKGSLTVSIRKRMIKKYRSSQKKITFSDLKMNKAFSKDIIITQEGVRDGSESDRGIAVRSDHIEDIPLGAVTQLNTSENMFYSFMNRFKKQVEGHWRIKVQNYLKRSRYGRIPASVSKSGDYVTDLMIFLDDSGKIIKVSVESSSGVHEIDHIAVTSIKKIGAFPNPPKRMAKNGIIEIPFGFRLY